MIGSSYKETHGMGVFSINFSPPPLMSPPVNLTAAERLFSTKLPRKPTNLTGFRHVKRKTFKNNMDIDPY
jgi:hypothetical protein